VSGDKRKLSVVLCAFSLHHKRYQSKTYLVFAEGFGMHDNPYFRQLPLDGTKGELFIIKAAELVLDVIVNTSIFYSAFRE
jgi:hypothetical protein